MRLSRHTCGIWVPFDIIKTTISSEGLMVQPFFFCVIAWTPKVCGIIAFWATFRRFGPLFYLLWGFR